jgi:hypothetical protein
MLELSRIALRSIRATCASLRAKRSNPSGRNWRHGLRRCARNDVDIHSRSRGMFHPRFASSFVPLKTEGAGKTGRLPHPRSRVPVHMAKAHTSIQVRREHPGLPCAMALRLTSRSSRRTALLPPSPALLIASLAPAPRRPNHATSPYASGACVSRAFRVHRIPPRVRDVRNAPLIG